MERLHLKTEYELLQELMEGSKVLLDRLQNRQIEQGCQDTETNFAVSKTIGIRAALETIRKSLKQKEFRLENNTE